MGEEHPVARGELGLKQARPCPGAAVLEGEREHVTLGILVTDGCHTW